MLWLAAAGGFVLCASTRTRRSRRTLQRTSPVGASCHQPPSASPGANRPSCLSAGQRKPPTDWLVQLKQSLTAGVADDAGQDAERISSALERGAEALPRLVGLVQAQADAETLTDATEILALLSPSRRGLQAVMLEAGVLPPLLALLAACPAAQQQQQPCAPQQLAAAEVAAHVSQSTGHPPATAGADAVGASGGCGGNGGCVPPAALALALRTLVNLTSNPRAAGPVRQAILRHDGALAAVLRLLCAGQLCAGQLGAAPGTDELGAEPGASGSGGGGEAAGAMPAAELQQAGAEVREAQGQEAGAETEAEAEAARWQLAGLAAWLLAHLCSAPAGQLQLVQEGVVPLLVRLVRQGRLAWAAAEAAAAAAAAQARSCGRPPQDARSRSSSRGKVASRSSGSSSSAQGLCTAAPRDGSCANTAGGTATAAYDALPYILSAMQYGLMALVNVTYDNSAVQRAAAVGGALEELDALFGALLQTGALPGIRLEVLTPSERPMGRSLPSPEQGQSLHSVPAEQQEQEIEAEQPGAREQEQREEEEGEGAARRQQLRGCCAGVAKFGVWLLAHLSSSDPGLKAAIAGPSFGFVPKLIAFALAQPAPGSTPHPGSHQPPPTRPPQPEAPAARAPMAGGAAATPAALVPSLVVVQQYAAMALVNLTCGVPSTKAAVAAALDWPALAALLAALAEEHAPMPPPGTCTAAPAASSTSELVLYVVWLVQHLSLSPVAAAATDPRVIPPLVALLTASDPHVRLRCAAALGALCSSSFCDRAAGGAAAAAGAGAPPAAAPPHRAAFHAAGGLERLLAAARRERESHILAYQMLCASASVGEDDAAAVAAAVRGGALRLLERLLECPHAACLVPAAEALQSLARAARGPTRRDGTSSFSYAASSSIAAAAADTVPRSLLSRIVAVMLTHADPRVRSALNEALGAVTALPGVRDRYCAVFAETLRDLVSAAEVELRVIPVN